MTYVSAVLRGFSCSIVVAGLSACTYLIPDDVSAPRYNTVIGSRHKPVRNTGEGASLNAPSQETPLATAAPVVPVAVNTLSVPIPSSIQYSPVVTSSPVVTASSTPAPTLRSIPLPPVDPVVEAKAKQLTDSTVAPASNVVVAARQVPSENPGAPVRVSDNGRHAPVENRSFMMAQNSAPQGLMNVPARPVITGPDSASARLNDARRDLEESRAETAAAKEQLTRDVVAEPSVFATPTPAPQPAAPEVLSPLPAVVAPAPAPVQRVAPKPAAAYIAPAPLTLPPPLPPIAQAAKPLPKVPTSAAAIQLSSPTPLETPATVPVASTRLATGVKSFDPMAALPPQPPVLAPIQLTPPADVVASAAPVVPQYQAEAAPAAAAPGATTSAFNPLAGANVSSSSTADANLRYLTPSRYAYRR